jgi:hypothetical protein
MVSNRSRFQSLCHTFLLIVATMIWHEKIDAASLQLTWADNSQNEDGFDIERKAGTNGVFLALLTVEANQKSYTDANLSNGTTYCYRVRAFNSIGGSPYSNEACATTSASAPAPGPSANTISTNIANGAVLSGSAVIWTAVPSGVPVRVEFFIDGTLGTTELQSPYQFNGDPSGTLNTNTLAMAPISSRSARPIPTTLSPNEQLVSRFQIRAGAEDTPNFAQGGLSSLPSPVHRSRQSPRGVYSVLRLRRRAEYAHSNSVHTQHRRNNHIDAHSLAFCSCHHDTSSLVFDHSLAATHEA